MQTNKVSEAIDFRSFLIQYADQKKKMQPGWSYSVWSRALGLKSTSSITKILSGDREPGDQLTSALVDYFKFNPSEEEHFRNLVLLSKNRDNKHIQNIVTKSAERSSKNFMFRMIEIYKFQYISEWYHLSIRELARLRNFKFNPNKIALLFKNQLNSGDVSKSVTLLKNLGLVERNDEGGYVAVDNQVRTATDIPSEAIRLYHKQMLEQAKIRLDDTPVEEREYQALTLLLDSTKLPQAKALIREFAMKLEALTESPKVDQVYQFQVQLFPITKKFDEPYEVNKNE